MKAKTVCFSGHRMIPENQRSEIYNQLLITVSILIQKGYRYFGAGGALGFDTMAAQAVLTLKQSFPHIRLILVLPCRTQADYWCTHDKEIYESIKASADKIVYISKNYTHDCMRKRNQHLVNYSSLCLCYLKKTAGGTAYTVKYAKENNLQIINIADCSVHNSR